MQIGRDAVTVMTSAGGQELAASGMEAGTCSVGDVMAAAACPGPALGKRQRGCGSGEVGPVEGGLYSSHGGGGSCECS